MTRVSQCNSLVKSPKSVIVVVPLTKFSARCVAAFTFSFPGSQLSVCSSNESFWTEMNGCLGAVGQVKVWMMLTVDPTDVNTYLAYHVTRPS